MRILVLGSTGMLGHQLAKSLSAKHKVEAPAGFDVRRDHALRLFEDHIWATKPDVVINCIGIVKQRQVTPAEMIEVNALFPHKLAAITQRQGVRLIHFSTDCVFSGRKGHYTENDEPDPQDLYGRSKLLGEVYDQGCITLRTSIVGRELNGRKQGLVEWFLQQRGIVPGYAHSFFSGLTTIEMARVVELVLHSPDVHGVWHVGGPTISKGELLLRLGFHYPQAPAVARTALPICDRSLDSTRFQRYFGYTPPSWDDMIKEMANADR